VVFGCTTKHNGSIKRQLLDGWEQRVFSSKETASSLYHDMSPIIDFIACSLLKLVAAFNISISITVGSTDFVSFESLVLLLLFSWGQVSVDKMADGFQKFLSVAPEVVVSKKYTVNVRMNFMFS
jgi:hypothetical protein